MKIQTLLLNETGFQQIRDGVKHETSRFGIRNISKGPLLIINRENPTDVELVNVLSIETKPFSQINDLNAVNEGFEDADKMKCALKKIYDMENITEDALFTFVLFQNVISLLECDFYNLSSDNIDGFVRNNPKDAQRIKESITEMNIFSGILRKLTYLDDYENLQRFCVQKRVGGLKPSDVKKISQNYYLKISGDIKIPSINDELLDQAIRDFLYDNDFEC